MTADKAEVYSLNPQIKYAIRFPIEIRPARNRVEVTQQIVNWRNHLGLSQADVEHKSGMQEGYVSKLEKPWADYGRCAFHNSFDDWIGALDLVVLVLPRAMFDGLESHIKAPAVPSGRPSWGAEDEPAAKRVGEK